MTPSELHEAMIAAAMEAWDRANWERWRRPAFESHVRERLAQVAQAVVFDRDADQHHAVPEAHQEEARSMRCRCGGEVHFGPWHQPAMDVVTEAGRLVGYYRGLSRDGQCGSCGERWGEQKPISTTRLPPVLEVRVRVP